MPGAGQNEHACNLDTTLACLQATASKDALPSALSALSARLEELAGVEAISGELQRIRSGHAPAANKLGLWHDLRDHALLRLVAAAWLAPLLATHVHVMVIVLGRHMYLEALARGARSLASGQSDGATSAPHLWPLSLAQQAAFMRFATYLVSEGADAAAPAILAAVREHARKHELRDRLTQHQVTHLCHHIECVDWRRPIPLLVTSAMSQSAWCNAGLAPFPCVQVAHLLSDIHAGVADALTPAGWADLLLPPVALDGEASPSSAEPALPKAPSPDLFGSAGSASGIASSRCSLPPRFRPDNLCDVEAGVVAELLLEVRATPIGDDGDSGRRSRRCDVGRLRRPPYASV